MYPVVMFIYIMLAFGMCSPRFSFLRPVKVSAAIRAIYVYIINRCPAVRACRVELLQAVSAMPDTYSILRATPWTNKDTAIRVMHFFDHPI